MNSLTEPFPPHSRHVEPARSPREWFEALCAGKCDQQKFFSSVGQLLEKTPDDGWDLLALVDQYYRRGKIDAALFGAVKAHLQDFLLVKNAGLSRSVSAPAHIAPTHGGVAAGAVTLSTPSRRSHLNAVPTRIPPTPTQTSASPSLTAPTLAPKESAQTSQVAMDAGSARAERNSSRPIAIGDVLRGRYRVDGLVGRGVTGTVYAATDQFRLDQTGDKHVALKVLHTEVIQQPRLFAELRREFQHLQALSHPNILRVHEFDLDGNFAFFTMEYLSGSLLSRVLSAANRAPLQRNYALAVIRDVGAAIAHAHGRGVVHGDLNPSNIFITDNGEIRVLDFGASHQLHQGPWISDFGDQQQVTVATPSFASCQVLEGEIADARDDIYALACISYVLLTGHHPFNDDNALKARTLRLTPARPRGLRGTQWHALRDALHFDRSMRPASIEAWLKDMELGDAPARLPELHSLYAVRTQRPRIVRWAAIAAATVLAMTLGWVAGVKNDSMARVFADPSLQSQALWARVKAAVLPAESPIAPSTVAQTIDEPPTAPAAVPAAPMTQPPAAAAVSPRAPAPSSASPASPAAIQRAPKTAAPPGSLPGTPGGQPSPTAFHSRIELAADSVDIPSGESVARVAIRRTLSLREDVSFRWWTESGTAKPGRDFVGVKSQVEHVEAGKNSVSLIIPVVVDPTRTQPRSFYVVIDEASDNATLGQRTVTQVTILPAEPSVEPPAE